VVVLEALSGSVLVGGDMTATSVVVATLGAGSVVGGVVAGAVVVAAAVEVDGVAVPLSEQAAARRAMATIPSIDRVGIWSPVLGCEDIADADILACGRAEGEGEKSPRPTRHLGVIKSALRPPVFVNPICSASVRLQFGFSNGRSGGSTLSPMSGVTILDGGMSRELMRLGAPFRQPEWSALSLIEAPGFVADAHRAFARAGATVLTTNAYAVVPFHLGDERFAAEGFRLARLAAELARSVADEFEGVRVAGCLPPALGSYRPDLFEAGAARPIVQTLVEAQAPFVDLWLAETVSSIAEVELFVEVLGDLDRALWVAFTLDDHPADGPRLRSGEPVEEAVRAVVRCGAEVVLFNCSQVDVMEAAVRVAVDVSTLPVGVYANALEGHTSGGANEGLHGSRADLTPAGYLEWARRWADAGASLIGGCCGILSDHINALSAELSAG
jgi:S-methylmethionine-dependent homocysteine/selenocysteine methylase